MHKLCKVIIFVITLTLYLSLHYTPVAAQPYIEPVKIRCTCYCYNSGITAAGNKPRMGLTVAGKPEWIGKACVLYSMEDDGTIGPLIGIFEFQDTGGELIKSGKRIDVYRNTYEGCVDWISAYGDYVYMQVIDAEG